MSRFWKFVLCLALVVQTAWSTAVHAAFNNPCFWQLNQITPASGFNVVYTSSVPYAHLEYDLFCQLGDGVTPCDGPVTWCNPKLQAVYCPSGNPQGNPVTWLAYTQNTGFGVTGCTNYYPGGGGSLYVQFELPNPPAYDGDYYVFTVDLYYGGDCTGTKMTSVSQWLYYSSSNTPGWRKASSLCSG